MAIYFWFIVGLLPVDEAASSASRLLIIAFQYLSRNVRGRVQARSRKSLSSLQEPHGRTEMLVANGRTISSGPAGRLEAFRNGAGSRLPNKASYQRLRS